MKREFYIEMVETAISTSYHVIEAETFEQAAELLKNGEVEDTQTYQEYSMESAEVLEIQDRDTGQKISYRC